METKILKDIMYMLDCAISEYNYLAEECRKNGMMYQMDMNYAKMEAIDDIRSQLDLNW